MIAISINTKNSAATEYTNYDFNCLGTLDGIPIGGNSTGLYQLNSGDTDNGTFISSVIEWPTSDMGAPNPKRLRRGYIGYVTSGNLKITTQPNDGDNYSYIIEKSKENVSQMIRSFSCGRRRGKGSYWKIKLSNVNGCDFGVDYLNLEPVVLDMGHV